jgi:arginine decarboxylase
MNKKSPKNVCHFSIVKGYGYSNIDSISAFDHALLNAGIGNYNLVPVSSIIPGKAIKSNSITDIPPGTIVYCVLAKQTLIPKEIGTVCLGYSISNNYGVVAETKGTNKEETINKCSEMLKEMTSKRRGKFTIPIIESLVVKSDDHKYTCGIVVLLFINNYSLTVPLIRHNTILENDRIEVNNYRNNLE